MIYLKTKEQIQFLDNANRYTHMVLDEVQSNIKPGITTDELNDIAESASEKLNVVPAFKNYRGFTKSICISINQEIVHGIPGNKVVKNGDAIKIDFGAIYQGYYGDAARTILVGDVDEKIKKLSDETKRSLMAGIKQMCVGQRFFDVCGAIEAVAKENHYGIIRNYGGHGISNVLHEEPFIPNYVNSSFHNFRLAEGMVFAIEPMFCLGQEETIVASDGWTVETKDGSIASHWEFSVAILNGQPKILGVDDGNAKL